jgi:hypothetical protein
MQPRFGMGASPVGFTINREKSSFNKRLPIKVSRADEPSAIFSTRN